MGAISSNGVVKAIIGSAENSIKSNEEGFLSKMFGGMKEGVNDMIESSGVNDLGVVKSMMAYEGRGTLGNETRQLADGQMSEVTAGLDKAYADAVKNKNQSLADEIQARKDALVDSKGSYEAEPGFFSKAGNVLGQIGDYYTKGDAKDTATKVGVTAGAYGAGAIGLRYLSGGTLTTNNQGESDIAGIPFI